MEIVKQIIEGDQRAFKRLVDSYKSLVFRTCYGFVHNTEDAEDIGQEVFITVYKSIGDFRQESKLSTWIYRIAVNKSLNFIRNSKIKKNYTTQLNEESLKLEDNTTIEYIDTINMKNLLLSVIEKLPKKQRVAFSLNKFNDLTPKEIAEVMEISQNAVEVSIFRARKTIKKHLLKHYKNEI